MKIIKNIFRKNTKKAFIRYLKSQKVTSHHGEVRTVKSAASL